MKPNTRVKMFGSTREPLRVWFERPVVTFLFIVMVVENVLKMPLLQRQADAHFTFCDNKIAFISCTTFTLFEDEVSERRQEQVGRSTLQRLEHEKVYAVPLNRLMVSDEFLFP